MSRRQRAEARRTIAELFRRFAREVGGRSPLYVEICGAVAESPPVLDFLAALPQTKWQPNVLLGVVRYLYGTPGSGTEFVALVERRGDEIAPVMMARSTQTNEPARCATLLPLLATLPQPLALLEVGAAAGLCLLPDYYAYDYGDHAIEPVAWCGIEPPRFSCRASAGTPLPERNLEIAWRAGLDLNPIDLHDEAEIRWVEALVWPGEEYRLPRLRAACDIARAVAPLVVQGDLRTDLAALAARAPPHATLVVFHTAVLAYVRDRAEREAFAHCVGRSRAVWVANEGRMNIPGVPDLIDEHPDPGAFLLCRDREPVAWTDGHGTWIDWRASSRRSDAPEHAGTRS